MSKHFQVCSVPDCKIRLPAFEYDGHSKCSSCIGQLCSFDNHCIECAGWDNAVFDRYLKHRHTLELSRLRKAKHKAKANLGNVGVVSHSAHSVSPSPPTSVVNLSSSSSISAYSPSALPKTIPSTPTSTASAPSDHDPNLILLRI